MAEVARLKHEKTVPEHLSAEAADFYRRLTADYRFDEAGRALLQLAAEAYDRYASARRVLEEQGTTYVDRFGAPRARPEVTIERDGRLAFVRIVRELGLEEETARSPLELRPRNRSHR